MALDVSDYHEDDSTLDLDESVLQDSQNNLVEFAKKYFRGAQARNRSVHSKRYILLNIIVYLSNSEKETIHKNCKTILFIVSDSYRKKSKKSKDLREPSDMVKYSKVTVMLYSNNPP